MAQDLDIGAAAGIIAKRMAQLRFVYRKSQLKHGSTTMRAHQLMAQVQPHLEGRLTVALDAIPSPKFPPKQWLWARQMPHGTFLFFSKNAARKLLTFTRTLLRDRGCVICFDYVDSDLSQMAKEGVDIHLAASLSAQAQMQTLQAEARARGERFDGQVELLLHNVDSRLLTPMPLPDDHMRPVYFGSPAKAVLPSDLRDRIALLDATNTEIVAHAIGHLGRYNFHYAVTPAMPPEEGIVCRPFTKGFTAAVLGAPIMVNRDAEDAEAFLGADYPFFVDSIEPDALSAALDQAEAAFGGTEWTFAQDRMKGLADQVSPQNLANQLYALWQRYLG